MEWSTVVRERFDCQHASSSHLSLQQQSCEIPRFSSRYPSSPLPARSTSAELFGGGGERNKDGFGSLIYVQWRSWRWMGFRGGGVEFSAFAQGRMRCRARPIHSFVPSNLYPSSILPIHRLSSAPPTHPIDFLHARLLPHFSPPKDQTRPPTYTKENPPTPSVPGNWTI